MDLGGEERASRAWACRGALGALRPRLDAIYHGSGELAPRSTPIRGRFGVCSIR